MNKYAQLIEKLKIRKLIETDHMVILPKKDFKYWLGLPAYGHIYIRPAYDLITDDQGLAMFMSHFLEVYEETQNDNKKIAIKAVVFPLYRQMTGRNYDTKLVAL